NNSTQSMDILKQEVDAAHPAQQTIWTYSTANGFDGFVVCVNSLATQLAAFGNTPVTATFCDGSQHSGPASTVLSQLQTYYNSVVTDACCSALFQFINETQGFVPSAYEYRNDTVALDAQDILQVGQIRNDLDLSGSQAWLEYVLPSKKTTGTTYR